LPSLVGCSNTATLKSRYACQQPACVLLVVCYPSGCGEDELGCTCSTKENHTRLSQTTNKHPPSETTPLAKGTIVEEHIMVGQTRNILQADKVWSAIVKALDEQHSTQSDWPGKGGGQLMIHCWLPRAETKAARPASQAAKRQVWSMLHYCA
jgi:hypothetical protein